MVYFIARILKQTEIDTIAELKHLEMHTKCRAYKCMYIFVVFDLLLVSGTLQV